MLRVHHEIRLFVELCICNNTDSFHVLLLSVRGLLHHCAKSSCVNIMIHWVKSGRDGKDWASEVGRCATDSCSFVVPNLILKCISLH